ncbi:MAG: PD-(D/E)XK nuclease family protein [Chitinophagaceae bacterium]|nr:PD-(D/E)XK nuclease family protein [Anaerolineae bacterium]
MMAIPANFQFTQSNLQDYVECARRFELRYLQKLKWPAVETEPIADREYHMRQGAAFHHLIHQYLVGVPAEAISQTAKENPLHDWWESFLRSDILSSLPPQRYPETSLSTPIGTYRLLAKYDLIAIEAGQKAVIIDWKTSLKRPKREDLARRMQTLVYPYVLAQAGTQLNNGQPLQPEQIEMIYWFAEEPNRPERFSYDAFQLTQDEQLLDRLIEEISTRTIFELTPDERKCRFCVYRSLCRRGVEAGDFQEQQDLEAENGFDLDFNFDQIAEVEF